MIVETQIDVSLEAVPGVALVSFRRGDFNFLSYPFLDELSSAVESAAACGAKAVVLATTGRRFCAGADFTRAASGAVGPSIYDIVPRLFNWPVPVVAAVGGAAVGGGFGLALVSDFRVVAEPAYFLANFARLGITPGFGMTVSLPDLVGKQKASEILYSSRRIGAKEAHDIGLADRLVAGASLTNSALEFAGDIAQSAPAAVSSIRRDLRTEMVERVEQVLSRERAEQERLMATEDFKEGTLAWRERRTPRFTGAN